MADTEVASMTEQTAPAVTDLLYLTDSGGTIDRKVTVATLRGETAGATVATQETTTSTTYADLTTSGPAATVTVPASGKVKVTITCELENTSSTQRSYASFAISGATTSAATDARSVVLRNTTADPATVSRTVLLTGLTAGSTTFTMKYKVGGGTGTFLYRDIVVETVP